MNDTLLLSLVADYYRDAREILVLCDRCRQPVDLCIGNCNCEDNTLCEV